MALKENAKVVTGKDLKDVYICNSFLKILKDDKKVNWNDSSKLLASIRAKGGKGELNKDKKFLIGDPSEILKSSVNLKNFTSFNDLLEKEKINPLVLTGVVIQFLSMKDEKEDKKDEEKDLEVLKKGECDIRLFQLKTKVAVVINRRPDDKKSLFNSMGKELKMERDDAYYINKKLNKEVMNIAKTYKGIKLFYNATDVCTGVYIGKKCTNFQEAEKKLKDLVNSDSDSFDGGIRLIKGGKCADVEKKIIEFLKSNKLKIDEDDIQKGLSTSFN